MRSPRSTVDSPVRDPIGSRVHVGRCGSASLSICCRVTSSIYPRFFRCHSVDSKLVCSWLSPGNLDTITNSSEQDIGKQSAFTCCTNRVPVPPLLPGTLPAGRQSSVVLDRPWRKSGGQQRSPCGVAFVPGRQAFLVKQRIPVLGKPFHQREKVPVDRLCPLTVLLVGTQVPTLHPKLEAAPGHADFRLRGLAVIGIRSERQPQCEFAGVPGKPLPSSAHLLTRSIPVRPDVTPTYALLIEPLAPDAFRIRCALAASIPCGQSAPLRPRCQGSLCFRLPS